MIEYIQIKDLKLLDNNPRSISKEQFKSLCKSLKDDQDFFLCRPILVNRVNGELIVYAGNQRVRAAKKLGWKEVPCIVEDNLYEPLMQSRIIKDNAHYGEWDFDLLSNFDIEMLFDAGFTERMLLGAWDKPEVPEIIDAPADEKVSEKKKKPCPNCGFES